MYIDNAYYFVTLKWSNKKSIGQFIQCFNEWLVIGCDEIFESEDIAENKFDRNVLIIGKQINE
jgi:hypothetical protein